MSNANAAALQNPCISFAAIRIKFAPDLLKEEASQRDTFPCACTGVCPECGDFETIKKVYGSKGRLRQNNGKQPYELLIDS